MKKRVLKLIIFVILIFLILCQVLFAVDVDKMGRVLETISKPTAANSKNLEQISDAERIKNKDASKNIYSEHIIMEPEFDFEKEINKDNNYTLIRKSVSISKVPDNKYEIINDEKSDRIKLKIRESGVGEWYAQNGFYEVNNKTFYFDENGLMVLGLAKDPFDNYYYFSEETGELIDEIPAK